MRFTSRIEYNKARIARQSVKSVPIKKTAPKLRERWPFLNSSDIPVELQALVTQRITRWHEYTNLYQQLRDCDNIDQLSNKAGRLLFVIPT